MIHLSFRSDSEDRLHMPSAPQGDSERSFEQMAVATGFFSPDTTAMMVALLAAASWGYSLLWARC
jgi:hypothetical protein